MCMCDELHSAQQVVSCSADVQCLGWVSKVKVWPGNESVMNT